MPLEALTMRSDLGNPVLVPRRTGLIALFVLSALLAGGPLSAYSQESADKKVGDAPSNGLDESDGAAPGVSFSEQMLSESDEVNVRTWFSNQSSRDLTDLRLEIFGPSFLEWHDKDCSGPTITNPLPLDAPARFSFVEHGFCTKLKSGNEVRIGDFNILFLYHYQWKEGETLKQSVSSVEKPLKIVLLGNDSIVGIPLGLAGLVVPGLFFWFGVSLWKSPWSIGLALGEKLFYSMIVSVVFVVVGAWLTHIPWLPHKSWLLTMDVLRGVSLARLEQLALTGMFVGTVAGGIDRGLRWYRLKKQQERTIKGDDSTDVLLAKLLRNYPDLRKPLTTVRLKDNRGYSGSLGWQTENSTLIIGWFAVSPARFPGKSARTVQNYLEKNLLADALDLARSKHVEVELDEAVQQRDGQTTGEGSMRWKNDEITEFKIEPGKAPREPLGAK